MEKREDHEKDVATGAKVSNPVALWLDSPTKAFSVTEVAELFALYLVNASLRAIWNQSSLKDGRAWYERREAGLLAYARHEAMVRLRPFATGGKMSGDAYMEAVLWCRIEQDGGNVAIASMDFDEFFLWKRRHDVGFFVRLGARLGKRNEPEGRFPDLRMRLYAHLYDRGVVPLEFCTDDYAAWMVNGLQRAKKRWLEEVGLETNAEAVRGWRRILGLRLAKPSVAKFKRALVHLGEPEASQYLFDRLAASHHGVPFVPPDDSLVPAPKKRK